MELSAKKLKINARTPQTFYSELIIPFVIVLLFVAIGQADFLQEAPRLDLDATKYEPSVLYYNDKYSEIKAADVCSNPVDPSTCKPAPPPTYSSPSLFVDNNMICSSCKSTGIWTKKEELAIGDVYLNSKNKSTELIDFEI